MTFGSDNHENELLIRIEIRKFKVPMFSPLQHSSLIMRFTVVQGKGIVNRSMKKIHDNPAKVL